MKFVSYSNIDEAHLDRGAAFGTLAGETLFNNWDPREAFPRESARSMLTPKSRPYLGQAVESRVTSRRAPLTMPPPRKFRPREPAVLVSQTAGCFWWREEVRRKHGTRATPPTDRPRASAFSARSDDHREYSNRSPPD